MEDKKLTIREKLVFSLIVFLIKMLKPWQYEHQFDAFWIEMKTIINGSDFVIPAKK